MKSTKRLNRLMDNQVVTEPKSKDPMFSGHKKNKKVYNDTHGYKDFSLTPGQKHLQNLIRENTLVFCEVPAGSGKSLSVLHLYAQMYLQDNTKKIIIIRTPCEAANKDKVGFLPNGLEEKIEPHFASSKRILVDCLNKGKVETDLGNRIQFSVPNFMLGATLDNSLVLIDEAQQLEKLTMKLILERIGKDSKVVVMGDKTQVYSDNRDRNGLSDALEKFFLLDGSNIVIQPRFDSIAYHRFSVEEIQRSEICKTVVRAYGYV